MAISRCLTLPLRVAVLLALGFIPALRAQAANLPVSTPVALVAQSRDSQEVADEAHRELVRDQQKKANEERFRKLKEDTEKLVRLSNELKEYVDKANQHTLTLDVIKKAEEIEKLAKSVKEKMKGQ